MADGKPFSAWLSGDLLKQASRRCDEVANGNESKYVRTLIERDVAASEPGQLLAELARQYHPAAGERVIDLVSRHSAAAAPVFDQKLVVMRLLDALVNAAESDPAFRADRPFEVVGQKRLADFHKQYDQNFEKLASVVNELRADYTTRNAGPVTVRPKPSKKTHRRPTGPTPPLSSAG